MKIYGVQRSGTNWLKYLLEENFRNTIAVDLPLGSKHHPPAPFVAFNGFLAADQRPIEVRELPYHLGTLRKAMTKGRVGVALIVKPLLPWLVSYYRLRRLKDPGKYSEFTVTAAAEWARHWVELNRQFVEAVPSLGWNYTVIDYAELLIDLPGVLERSGYDLGLRRTRDGWRSSDRATRRSSDAAHGADVLSPRAFDHTYYGARRYLDELSPELLAAVHGALAEAGDLSVLTPYLGEEVS